MEGNFDFIVRIILKNNYVVCENGKIDEWSRYI